MATIEKLVIEGYRGINYFKYEPNMINILVGRNNTGKSSVLEAAAIVSTSSSGFQNRLGNNILREIIQRKGWGKLEYFFNLNLEEKKLRLIGIIDEVETEVRITYDTEHQLEILEQKWIIDQIRNYLYGRYPPKLTDFQHPSSSYYIDKLEAKMLKILKKPMLICETLPTKNFFVALPELKVILPRVRLSSNVIFYGNQFSTGFNIKNIYYSLIPTERLHQTVDYLRNRIPFLNDIRSDGREIWIYFENLPQPLPLSMIGDGMKETIRLMFFASLIKGGALLMEEPENNLHPGLYDLVTERLVEVAQQDRTQIFLSTHNLEFAEKLLRNGGELVNVVRLFRVKDEIAYEVLSHREALEELDELHIDLRGP